MLDNGGYGRAVDSLAASVRTLALDNWRVDLVNAS